MGGSPNLETSFTLSSSCTSRFSIPRPAQSPSTLQTPRIPNHLFWHTLKTTCPLFCTKSTECTKPRVHIQPITCHATPQKDIPIPYMAQARHPLNIEALAIFFPFTTIPAALHYFSIHSIH